jgi:deoxyribodipyrimidine photolyase-like uncharacterized protein
MTQTQSDAIQFLNSSIDRYRHELDDLRQVTSGRINVVELAKVRMRREQLAALIEDARQLLVQLRTC